MKTLLIGQAPGPNTRADQKFALYPHPPRSAGYRLYQLVKEAAGGDGFYRQTYLNTFDRLNLLEEYPGPKFPVTDARLTARAWRDDLTGRRIVLMGAQLADAFEVVKEPFCEWREDAYGIDYAVVPHTSGLNRWYNDPANRALAVEFFRDILTDQGLAATTTRS